MERLTARQAIKHADGTSHIVTYCHGHRYGPAAFPDKYGTSNPQEYENYCEMVDRLAAYEDIGTVEDLQRLVTAQNEMSKRLDDLLKAKSGDEAETYTTGYRNGHQNGQIELLQCILNVDTGIREEAAEALTKEDEGK